MNADLEKKLLGQSSVTSSMGLRKEAADLIAAVRRILLEAKATEFEGSCCGCSRDDGFDKIQELIASALAALGEPE